MWITFTKQTTLLAGQTDQVHVQALSILAEKTLVLCPTLVKGGECPDD